MGVPGGRQDVSKVDARRENPGNWARFRENLTVPGEGPYRQEKLDLEIFNLLFASCNSKKKHFFGNFFLKIIFENIFLEFFFQKKIFFSELHEKQSKLKISRSNFFLPLRTLSLPGHCLIFAKSCPILT